MLQQQPTSGDSKQASSTGKVLQGKGSGGGVAIFAWQRAMASAGHTNHLKSNNQLVVNSDSNSCH